jgi:hypothetical protein
MQTNDKHDTPERRRHLLSLKRSKARSLAEACCTKSLGLYKLWPMGTYVHSVQ